MVLVGPPASVLLSLVVLSLVLAAAGSAGPGLIISKSMAQCRASCISSLAPTHTPGEETCKRSALCSTCWTTCAQLAVHYPIWSFKCHQADSCDEGCQTACNFFTKANATPPPPPSSPTHPSHHPSVYIPPIPPTHPTPPAKLSMEFDERGAAKWTLVWSDRPSTQPTKTSDAYEDISVEYLFKSSAVNAKQESGSDSNDGVNSCSVCGACGVVFGVFYKKMHHHPWTLYRQTQASFMDLESIEVGSQLQLIAVANCGTVSVIITPYQPVISKSSDRTNKTDSKTNYSRGDLYMHERRYETLAQHYASKRAKVNYEETTTTTPVQQHDREANSISASAMGSSELMEVPLKSSTWTLHFNASVNMTDLIYTKIWWNPSDIATASLKGKSSFESQNKVKKSNEKSSSDGGRDYLVTWEDQSGTIKGHSMTRNPYISFDLWPHTVYKIQAQVVMGPVIDSSVSNPLVIDAARIYQKLSKNLETKTRPNRVEDDENYKFSVDSIVNNESEVSDVKANGQNDAQISSQENDSLATQKSQVNEQENETRKFPLSDSYVYAEVETDYAPLYVKTAAFEPEESPSSVVPVEKFERGRDVVPEREANNRITDDGQSIEPKIEASVNRDISREAENTNKIFYRSESSESQSNQEPIARNSGTREVPLGADSHVGTQVEDLNVVLSGEIIAGIVAAFIVVLLIIVALALYMRYYIRRVSNKKGSFRADGYDTTSSASSKDTEKSDDCNNALGGKTTKTHNKNQWFPFSQANKAEIYSKADDGASTYGFVSKDVGRSNAASIDHPIASRCTSNKFPMQSSDCHMPVNKYLPNNSSNHSDNTSTTILSDGTTAGAYTSSSSDCSSNIRYTHSPHGQRRLVQVGTNTSTYCEQEETPAYSPQDEYVEIPDPASMTSRPMCALPDLTNVTGPHGGISGYQTISGVFVPYGLEEHSSQRAPRSLPYSVNDALIAHSRSHSSEVPENGDLHSRSHSNSSSHNEGFVSQNHYPQASTPMHGPQSSIPTANCLPPACIPSMYLPSSSCPTPNNCAIPTCPTPINYLPQSVHPSPNYMPVPSCPTPNNCMPSSACPTPTHMQSSSYPNSLQYMPPQTNANISCPEQFTAPHPSRGPPPLCPQTRVPEPLPRQYVPQVPHSKPVVPKKPVHLPHAAGARRAHQPVPQQRSRDC